MRSDRLATANISGRPDDGTVSAKTCPKCKRPPERLDIKTMRLQALQDRNQCMVMGTLSTNADKPAENQSRINPNKTGGWILVIPVVKQCIPGPRSLQTANNHEQDAKNTRTLHSIRLRISCMSGRIQSNAPAAAECNKCRADLQCILKEENTIATPRMINTFLGGNRIIKCLAGFSCRTTPAFGG